jgi:hypothetical protein
MKTISLSIFVLIYNLSLGQNPSELKGYDYRSTLRTCFSNNIWSFKENGKFGLINDKTHKNLIPAEYDSIDYVEDGGNIISVRKDNKCYLIDKNNKQISKKYDDITNSYLHSTMIASIDDKSILINFEGKEKGVFYDKIISNSGPSVVIVKLNNLYGGIDNNGVVKIPLKYQEIELKNGFKKISAKLNNQWGIIDSNNKVLVDFNYDYIEPSSDEYVVTKNKKKGILNNQNKLIVDYLYDYFYLTDQKIYQFYKYRMVKIESKLGIIDSIGNLIIPIQFDNLDFFYDVKHNKRIIGLKDKKWGIIDFNNNIILPFQYERINKKDGYSEIITFFNENPDEKLKVKNWSFNENDFVYFVKLNGEFILINEKQEILYKKNK